MDSIAIEEEDLTLSFQSVAAVVDLSVSIRSQACYTELGTTFKGFFKVLLNRYDAQRIDIAADQYNNENIKHQIRFGRKLEGYGKLMSFNEDTLVPVDMSKNLFTDQDNKKQPNTFIIKECTDAYPII